MNLFLLIVGALVYTTIAGSVLVAALRIPKTRAKKVAAAAIVFVAFSILPAIAVQHTFAQERAEAARKTEQQKYREAAWAHFRKRCQENARETINRVVENVEAIFLIKPRQRAAERDLVDQFWMGDPYGYSSYETLNPAGAYLYGRSGKMITGRQFSPIQGYQYVEMPNRLHREGSNTRPYVRYQLENVVVLNSVTKQPEKRVEPRGKEVDELLSRYGITWEDISTKEDRDYWIAGGKLVVIDLRTGEVVGERVGYVIDPTFGSTAQGRRIWLAVGFTPEAFCPRFEIHSHRNTEFVAKVLKATGENVNGK